MIIIASYIVFFPLVSMMVQQSDVFGSFFLDMMSLCLPCLTTSVVTTQTCVFTLVLDCTDRVYSQVQVWFTKANGKHNDITRLVLQI